MLKISSQIGDAIHAHARQAYPKECCGVIVRTPLGEHYHPCRNIEAGDDAKDRFALDPHDWMAAEESGEIVAVVHSHPDASAHPTDADRVMCNRTGLPWLILSYPGGVMLQCQPNGQRLPLVGRTFHHGVVDCYTLVRDYYAERLGLELPDIERPDDWWDNRFGPALDLYRDHFAEAGFVELGSPDQVQPQPHDACLMQIRADRENHAAVFDAERPGLILHHLHGRLSGHDVWGGYWQRHTRAILRHKSLMPTSMSATTERAAA